MIKYSIIMPVYNAALSLNKSINSIISQTYRNWELIVVNDGSTDDSEIILNEFSALDSRIIIINQKNSGPGVARNTAMKNSNGDYIAFLDSDDYWEDDFLELINDKIIQNECDIVFIEMLHEREDGTVIGKGNTFSFNGCNKYDLICNQMTGRMSWGMGKVIRRELIDVKRSSFSELPVGEEAIFSFDVLEKAGTIGFIEKPIYHYVQSATGQHKKGNTDPWRVVVKRMKEHIIEENVLDVYDSNINSFALRAFCIAAYRIASNLSIMKAVGQIKKCYDDYRLEYDFNNLNMKSLDKASILILWLMKLQMSVIIIIGAKLRKLKLKY